MAEDWLNRAMALQQSANWPPVKAVNECRLALRGMASEWYMGLALDQAECYELQSIYCRIQEIYRNHPQAGGLNRTDRRAQAEGQREGHHLLC